MTTYLYVDRSVSTLQFDLDTDGVFMIDSGIAKDAITNKIGNLLRVIIFRLNAEEFSGRFGSVDSAVLGISGVVGARADASDAGASVTSLSQIENVSLIVTG